MTKRNHFNEGRACDAVIRYLERRYDLERTNLRFPERDNHPAPVELAFELGPILFAMEHTGIEPFEGHVQTDATADVYVQPIQEGVKGSLPAADLELYLPAGALSAVGRRELAAVQAALVDWVKGTAPSLPAPHPHRVVETDWVKLPHVPFEVQLRCMAGHVHPGTLVVVHVVADLPTKRDARILRASQKKQPKLARWKSDYGARTVLILEENDIQLTNAQVVAESLGKADQSGALEAIDDVYLVTSMGAQWAVYPLRMRSAKVDPLWHLVRRDITNEALWEVEASSLVDLTERVRHRPRPRTDTNTEADS